MKWARGSTWEVFYRTRDSLCLRKCYSKNKYLFQKPSENPLKDVILAGSEASGSDFLREYGPPKVQEISQNLINQGLPDAVTEQSFEIIPIVVEIKEVAEVAENVEGK